MNKPLTGKVALLTGAVRRSGRDAAIRLAEDGAKIVINAKNSRALAENVVAEINDAGGTAMVHMADITDEAQVEEMIGHVASEYGGLDILVNNAGHTLNVTNPFCSIEDWRNVFALNFRKRGLSRYYVCEKCGKRRKTTKVLHAHHIFSWDKYPNLRYSSKNGVVMCIKCHNGFHRKYKFDALDKPDLLLEYVKDNKQIKEYIYSQKNF